MTIDTLEKEIKDEKLRPIYLLYGEETYLLENVVKRIKKIFGEMRLGINYIELSNENVINALMPELQTPPFGYNKKLIIIKNSALFKKEIKKKTPGIKELREELEKYLKNNKEEIKQNLVLIFIEDSVDKLNITKQVEESFGAICEFPFQKPIQIEKMLLSITNAYKVNVETRSNYEINRYFWYKHARAD